MIGNIAYNLGKKLGPRVRKAKWLYKTMTSNDNSSITSEYELGLDIRAEIMKGLAVSKEQSYIDMVSGIGKRLSGKIANTSWKFSFCVYTDPTPNAFAIPGGFVFIADSIIRLCDNDVDQVAFILAHEMGHITRRHCFHRTINEYAINTLKTVPARGKLAPLLKNVGLDFFIKNYSRTQEFEADKFAVILSYASGFNPVAGARMMQRLGKINPSRDDYMKYFSTHPPHNERIRQILAVSKQAVKDNKK